MTERGPIFYMLEHVKNQAGGLSREDSGATHIRYKYEESLQDSVHAYLLFKPENDPQVDEKRIASLGVEVYLGSDNAEIKSVMMYQKLHEKTVQEFEVLGRISRDGFVTGSVKLWSAKTRYNEYYLFNWSLDGFVLMQTDREKNETVLSPTPLADKIRREIQVATTLSYALISAGPEGTLPQEMFPVSA